MTRPEVENPWKAIDRVLGDPTHIQTIVVMGPNADAEIRRFLATYPSAHLHCFEPTPIRFRALKKTYKGHPRVTMRGEAMAERASSRSFYLNANDVTNSLFEANPDSPYYGLCRPEYEIRVKTTTLDLYCHKERIHEIDLLFMDIQGAEYLALKGASQLLANGAIRAIFGEVMFTGIYHGLPGFCDIHGLMREFGYKLMGFYRLAWYRSGRLQWADFLYDKGAA